jgi:DNA processing protein
MLENLENTVDTWKEMVAYETLWAIPNETLKTISERFAQNPVLPSELLAHCVSEHLFNDIEELKNGVENYLRKFNGFSVCVNGSFQYPERLQKAKYPIELFYYKGDIGLLESRCVSVVGSRKCSDAGLERARKLARGLVENGYTVVSGLALGIDTAAMKEVVEIKGNTIGVIGTPINQYYPTENRDFQDYIAKEKLLISQVPFYRYQKEPFIAHRKYFPQRNETMASLSEATIIVEASDSSGSLTQARACLQQNKKLFILNSCFQNPAISWPEYYEKKGAIRVKDWDDILPVLASLGCAKSNG